MTRWVTRLLIANVAVFLLTLAAPQAVNALMFVPVSVFSRPWTLATYMFAHADIMHLLFNMLGLFFFGPRLEVHLGSRNFLLLYFFSGFVGALLSFITPYVAIVGASGAVFGVLMAFAIYWPRDQIYIWGVLPIQARWLVVILTALSLFGGFGAGFDSVAHFAHLGGFAGGYLFVRWTEYSSSAARFQRTMEQSPLRDVDLERWKTIDPSTLHEVNRAEYDRIMEKISQSGVGQLTSEEISAMNRFSMRLESSSARPNDRSGSEG